MEIHNRLMNLPTTGITVLEILFDNPERKASIIRELIEACNKKICNNFTDLKILEIFRMILCYEYQSLINSQNDGCPFESNESTCIDVKTLFLKNIDCLNTEEFTLLYDIVVLQLVLRSNEQQFAQMFRDFHATQKERITTKHENKDLCMRVYECFVDSYNLRFHLYKRDKQTTDFVEPSNCILVAIESWMKQEEKVEWRLLASLLPKLVAAFGIRNILTPLWNKVFVDPEDLGKTLTTLCVMADVCFPCEETNIRQTHFEQCLQKEFWLILLGGLISSIYQQRKQALYLVKRALDFMESHESKISNESDRSKGSIAPFVRMGAQANEPSPNLVKINFFLILEVLEEKQKHLVLPTLTHLSSLLKAYDENKSRGYSFNVVWLRCIFKRILQHDNNAVKLLGMREVLRANLDLYDEEFFYFLANILNNTLLYEYDEINEKQPEIMTHLEEFFFRSEEAKMSLINTFVRAISRVSWCPVTIYWILQALLAVTQRRIIVHNAWTREELKCVKNLIEKNLTKHCTILRTNSQSLILQAFCAYTKPNSDWSDVELVTETLTSAREGLHYKYDGGTYLKIIEHISRIIKPSDAELYVIRTCDTLMDRRSVDDYAMTIILLVESKLICMTKNCRARTAIDQQFQNLICADLRPYANPASILKVIEFWYYLINIFSIIDVKSSQTLRMLPMSYGDAILKVLARSLDKSSLVSFDEYISETYAVITCINCGMRGPYGPDLTKELKNFGDKCLNIIINPHGFSRNQWLYALKILNIGNRYTNGYVPPKQETIILHLLRYFNDKILNDHRTDISESKVDSKGKFASDCCENIAKFVCEYVERLSPESWPSDLDLLDQLVLLVEYGSEHVIVPVAATFTKLLQTCPSLIVRNPNNVHSIIRLCWRYVFQLNKTKVFFSAIEELARLIINSEYLKLDGGTEFAIECVDQLMTEGESVPSLRATFIINMRTLPEKDLLKFEKPFISCLLRGAVPRHDQRIEQATISHCILLLVIDRITNNKVRALSVSALLTILAESKELKSEFRENVFNDLIGILEKNRNKRYFDNSHLHRLKHRVMQILLMMEPYLNGEERQILYDAMCVLLIEESNQPSVRLMQEWLLVRIYAKNSVIRDSIWELFETAAEKRSGSIVSIASVVFHVSRLLEGDTRIEFIDKAISHLLPNCMSQQFNVRLYSQMVLVKIYDILPYPHCVADKYRGIYHSVKDSLRRGNLMKNSLKLLNDFYFTKFHPNDDYCLETIFHQLPRLTGLSVDEWIVPDVFMASGVSNPDIRITSDKSFDEWENMKSVKQSRTHSFSSNIPRITDSRTREFSGDVVDETDESVEDGLSDIQKKIIPWKSMVPLSDEPSEISKATLSRRKIQNDDAGIIVVASLIDRPPNLGGLARTCEIFGAKELVIGSLRYADDREFQTLSVSAEKWITMTEVKSHLLKNYLLEKQSNGWKLVGAEQTANSTNLLEMEFDKRTILLLGNEKDGIPANLIPILDTCVEIPQNGVVRSLNVHVTGAICIWQYVKQHMPWLKSESVQ